VLVARYPIGSRFAALSSGTVFAMGLGFLVNVVIVRAFGAEGLAHVGLAQSLLTSAVTVGLWGTNIFAVQRVAAAPETLWRTVRTVRQIRFIAGTVAYLGILAVTSLVPGYVALRPIAMIFGLSLFVMAVSPEWVAQARHRADISALQGFATQLAYFSIAAVAVSTGAGLWAIPGAKVTADFLVVAGLTRWLYRRHPTTEDSPGRGDLANLARASAPICGTALLRNFALTSDVLILGVMAATASVGHYVGAARIFNLLLALATSYFVILLPRLAERGSESRAALDAELAAGLRRAVPIAAVAVGGVAVLATPVLTFLFGAEFAGAGDALRFLAAAAALNLVSRHYRQVLLVCGGERADFRLTAGSLAVHVGAKLALIPVFGLTGAALGTCLGEGYLLLAQRRAAHRLLAAR
jgi:O-antigen/teichoic acid export membrane protein